MEEKSIQQVREKIEAQTVCIAEPLFTSKSFPDKDWYLNAQLHVTPEKWDTYAEGYKCAGDIAVQYVIDNNWYQDFLVYPIVFLYRHYLELRLKDLYFVSSRLLDQDIDIPTNHNLLLCWDRVRSNIEQVWTDAGTKHALSKIEDRLKELNNVDVRSDAFRYPEDKQKKPTLAGLAHVNLKHLKEVVQGIANVLDGSSIGIGEYLDAKNEMMAEYRAEMAREYDNYY
jgi:hypothetical protein